MPFIRECSKHLLHSERSPRSLDFFVSSVILVTSIAILKDEPTLTSDSSFVNLPFQISTSQCTWGRALGFFTFLSEYSMYVLYQDFYDLSINLAPRFLFFVQCHLLIGGSIVFGLHILDGVTQLSNPRSYSYPRILFILSSCPDAEPRYSLVVYP